MTTYTQNTFGIELLFVEFAITISCISHVSKWQLNGCPVTMGNDNKSLEKITWNQIIGVDVEDKSVTTRSYTHFQSHIVTKIEWGFKYRRAECAE